LGTDSALPEGENLSISDAVVGQIENRDGSIWAGKK
jgi:hypothetical protein